MQVKKFEAPTIQDALDAIKRELGPEAIILQTKKNRKGFGLLSKPSVEITAAVAERSLGKKRLLDQKMPEFSKNTVQKMPATQQAGIYDKYSDAHLENVASNTRDKVEIRRAAVPAPAAPGTITARRYADIDDDDRKPLERVSVEQVAKKTDTDAKKLEGEIFKLRGVIDDLQRERHQQESRSASITNARTEVFPARALQDAYELLILNGVDKRYGAECLKAVMEQLRPGENENPEVVLELVANGILANVDVAPWLEGVESHDRGAPAIHALVGPTGVGKTTTIAKIASIAKLTKQLKVGLINLDTFKVSAQDQVETYAKILMVPYRMAKDEDELGIAIRDFGPLDLILVDTTGRSQRDQESLVRMQSVLTSYPGLCSHLVLSAVTRDAELYDMGSRFSVFKPQSMIISKIDEAMLFGSIYNLIQRLKLPVGYLTTGQKVPQDIEEATKERLVSLTMDL